MVYAIIESGGVQVRADLNGTVVVPHVQAEVGVEVSFPRVLLVADEKSVMVGTPVIEGATGEGQTHLPGTYRQGLGCQVPAKEKLPPEVEPAD